MTRKEIETYFLERHWFLTDTLLDDIEELVNGITIPMAIAIDNER